MISPEFDRELVNPYETDRLLHEYLLFHYGTPEEVLPYGFGPVAALGYPQRCVNECLEVTSLPVDARALDLGCAVGRSSFELARYCVEVIGVDYSARFVEAAESVRSVGELPYLRADEGELCTPLVARRPRGVDAGRVRFTQGNAMALPLELGSFDVVLMANLIDRLSAPLLCLERLRSLVRPGGQLVVTSPYTWMEEYTPKESWLGGRTVNGEPQGTLGGLKAVLSPDFKLAAVRDLPFLIREHSRKYQWSVAQASIWRRR